MSEQTWNAILERALSVPEGQQIRVCCGAVTLMLERRENVLIAMREIPPVDVEAVLIVMHKQRQTDHRQWQMLSINNAHYLCDWYRQPTDAGWLAALAGARI